jgi:hypothetical protein
MNRHSQANPTLVIGSAQKERRGLMRAIDCEEGHDKMHFTGADDLTRNSYESNSLTGKAPFGLLSATTAKALPNPPIFLHAPCVGVIL